MKTRLTPLAKAKHSYTIWLKSRTGGYKVKDFSFSLRLLLKTMISYNKQLFIRNGFCSKCLLILSLACLGNTAVFAQQKKAPKEIKKSLPVETRPSGQAILRVYDSVTETQFGLSESITGNDLPEKASNFIKANWKKFNIHESPESALKFIENRELLGTHVIRMRQLYKGLFVDQNQLTLTFNKENKLTGYFNNLIPVKQLQNVTPKIKKEVAEQKVMSYLQPDIVRHKTNELIVHIINFKAYLAYRIELIADNIPGDWVAHVDANSGEILELENVGDDLNGTGNVFDTDPVTAAQTRYGTGNYIDNGDATNSDLNAQMINVILPDITLSGGQYRLQGPFASISDHESPFLGLYAQSTSNFSYNRSQPAFEATMCYYHIDKSMRYINSTLGIPVMPRQYAGGVQFDPQGLFNGANAHYSPSIGKLAFGSSASSVDAAEDASIILHELGHGIHHWLIGGSAPSQNEGLSEGCGDYWAKSYERSLGYWAPGEWGYNHIFFWGMEPAFPGRVTNYSVRYPRGIASEPDPHIQGQLWSSVLMKIWNDIGKERTDRMFLVGLGYTNNTTNQAGAANALYQAAVNLKYSSSELCIIHHHFSATYGSYFTQPAPSSVADIFIQDTPADFGVEANPDTGPMWVSSDIWVRNTDDRQLLHQNPVYSATVPNYIYVRIHGRGCGPVTDAQLHVYFSKASSGLNWPSNWINFYTMTSHGSQLTGDEVTTVPVSIPVIEPGEEYIVRIPWFAPNPANFDDPDNHHFCLVARIVSATDPMFITETGDIGYNTKNNNNVAWKNVSVLSSSSGLFANMYIRTGPLAGMQELSFNSPAVPWNPNFDKNGQLRITLSKDLYTAWLNGGKLGNEYFEESPGTFLVKSSKFYLGGFNLNPQINYVATISYKPNKGAKACTFDLVQTAYDQQKQKVVVGGERFEYTKKVIAKDTTSPTGGGYKQLDVTGKTLDKTPQKQVAFYPNPVNNLLNISSTDLKDTRSISIVNSIGSKLMELPVSAASGATGRLQLNVASLATGIYIVQLKNDTGEIIASGKIIKL